jgi:hypothetical protein
MNGRVLIGIILGVACGILGYTALLKDQAVMAGVMLFAAGVNATLAYLNWGREDLQ